MCFFWQNTNFSFCHKHLALTSTQKQPTFKRQGRHCKILSSSTESNYHSFVPPTSIHCHDKPYLHMHDSGVRGTSLCLLQNIVFLLHYVQTWSQLTRCLCSHNSQPCSVCGAAHAIVHCFWYPTQLHSNSNYWQLFAAAWAAVRSMTTMLLWTWKAIRTFCFLFVL